MHNCPVCGDPLPSSGSLEIHQEVFHRGGPGESSAPVPAAPAPRTRSARSQPDPRLTAAGPGPQGPHPALVAFAVVFLVLLAAGTWALVGRRQGGSTALNAAASLPVASVTTTTMAAPPGFTLVTNRGAGFSLAVPGAWKQLAVDDPDFTRALAELKATNPKMAHALQAAGGLAGAGGKLLAADPGSGDNVNLIVQHAGNVSLDEVYRQIADAYAKLGTKVLSHEHTSIAGGDALLVRTVNTLQTASGPITLHQAQYVVVRNLTAFILTTTGTGDELGTIARSLTIT